MEFLIKSKREILLSESQICEECIYRFNCSRENMDNVIDNECKNFAIRYYDIQDGKFHYDAFIKDDFFNPWKKHIMIRGHCPRYYPEKPHKRIFQSKWIL